MLGVCGVMRAEDFLFGDNNESPSAGQEARSSERRVKERGELCPCSWFPLYGTEREARISRH